MLSWGLSSAVLGGIRHTACACADATGKRPLIGTNAAWAIKTPPLVVMVIAVGTMFSMIDYPWFIGKKAVSVVNHLDAKVNGLPPPKPFRFNGLVWTKDEYGTRFDDFWLEWTGAVLRPEDDK